MEDCLPEELELCRDEFAAHGAEKLTVSKTDLQRPATPTNPLQDLTTGLAIPPFSSSRSKSRRRCSGSRRRSLTRRMAPQSLQRKPSV